MLSYCTYLCLLFAANIWYHDSKVQPFICIALIVAFAFFGVKYCTVFVVYIHIYKNVFYYFIKKMEVDLC